MKATEIGKSWAGIASDLAFIATAFSAAYVVADSADDYESWQEGFMIAVAIGVYLFGVAMMYALGREFRRRRWLAEMQTLAARDETAAEVLRSWLLDEGAKLKGRS